MINKKSIVILIIFIALIRVVLMYCSYSNYKYEEHKTITGKIVYINESKDKTTMDILCNKKIRITVYKKVDYQLGDTILIDGVIATPFNNTIPNTFDYKKYLLTKKIQYISISPKITLIKKNNNIIYIFKNYIKNRIKKYKSYNYLSAFILGDKSQIGSNTKENYKHIGISHLFAVSGMHIGIFMFFLNFISKKSIKTILIFIVFVILLFLTDYSESLLRCFVFMILNYFNKSFKLKLRSETLIILTTSLLLIYNPFFIYSVGFMFSIVITFFIVISKDKVKGKYIAKLFKISLVCFFSSVPIIAYYFYSVNLISPFINVLIIPIMTFFIFPLGIMTFFFPFLDSCFFQATRWFEFLTEYISKINFLSFTISKPNILVIFIYYIILYIAIKKNGKLILLFIALMIVNINSRLLIFKPFITYLDVGQGDSSLIVYPQGKAILIDTGGVFLSNYSIVKNKTITYLNSLGINKIDVLILTHGDFDHMGEAINLVNNFKVEKVIFNCGPYNDLEKELIKVLDKKKIKYYSCVKELNIDNNKLYFLQTRVYDNENDNSNVIYTELNGYKFIFMGDAGVTTEKEIMDKYNLQDIDVLKVGHHGSRTSSGKDFINEIKPKYSIISVGKNNRSGHPNKEVLDNLKNSKIYRTDIDGGIMFKIKNDRFEIETCGS